MIMAAGLGTRLKPYTEIFPKPLTPIMGIPSIQFSFDLLNQTKVSDVMLNVHHKAETFLQQIRFLQTNSKLHFSDESEKLLGSGGGLRKVKSFFSQEKSNDPFFILNADTLCHLSLIDLERRHFKLRHEHGVEMTMVVFSKSPKDGLYREILMDSKKSLVKGLGELKKEICYYTGISILHPEIIPDALPLDEPSDFVKDILEPAIKRGKVGIYFYDNSLDEIQRSWFDIGSPKLWQETHLNFIKLLEENDLPTLWKNRVLSRNFKVKPYVWSNAKEDSLQSLSKEWEGPSYWGVLPHGDTPPEKLFKDQIIYGESKNRTQHPGISYADQWTDL